MQGYRKGRVIISPDGQYFPFEALITNKTGTPDYFLNDYSVSYTFSAKYLMSQYDMNATVAAPKFSGNCTCLLSSQFSITRIER